MSHNCGLCLHPYDYYESIATVICAQNHLACKKCVSDLIQSNSKCPYCLQPVFNPNAQQGWNAPQNYAQPRPYTNNAYWQPTGNQGQVPNLNPIVVNNQGFNPQPYVVPPIARNQGNPAKSCGLSVIFLVAAIVLLIIRIQMGSCSYWGAVDCGTSYGSTYCCDSVCSDIFDSSCGYLSFYENFGQEAAVTVGVAVCAGLAISFLMMFLRKRKIQQLSNRYAAMTN